MNIYGTSGINNLKGTADRDLIYGRDDADLLDGGDGNDVLYGGAGNDTLFGGEGDDQLSGGAGSDYMVGGNGNDTYYVDDRNDQVVEQDASALGGRDTVVFQGWTIDPIDWVSSYRIGANVEILRLESFGDYTQINKFGDRALNGSGNELANRIIGNAADNSIYADAGNDDINGGGGNDIINGGSGDDYMIGGLGNDTISFKVGAKNGVLVDLAISTKRQITGNGNDYINGFENLEGTKFADILTGDAGANKILGLDGGDTIRGGGGDDDLIGGDGADMFIFESALVNGVDYIRGFTTGQDKLQFLTAGTYSSDADFTNGLVASGTNAQFLFNSATDSNSSNDTDELYYDPDGTGDAEVILIAHIQPGTLQASDIII